MIVYKDIEQGSEDWFLIKWGKVGGSTAKGFVYKQRYAISRPCFLNIWKSLKLEESFDSFSMMRGRARAICTRFH